ncbi:cytochrome P450 27C1-like [Lineus longissimus]|uniref:cytochrome P450 27C1-like n=1 Tax=Lineus longissimus TaxID=88925 RepID=UPI002B4E2F98
MRRILSHHRRLHPVSAQFVRSVQAQADPTLQPPDHDKNFKSWRELPGPPKGFISTLIGYFTAMKEVNSGQMHVFYKNLSDTYGKMFKAEWPNMPPMVIMTDPTMVAELMRQEEKFPRRTYNGAWGEYRDRNGLSRGLLTSDDDTWWRYRKAIHKKMMRPKSVNEYGEQLDQVMVDLVEHIKRVKTKGDGIFVPNLANEFYRWGMEAACVVLFEKRFGCLEEKVNAQSQRFIDSIEKMFLTSMPLYNMLRLHKMFNTKTYRNHNDAWNGIFEIANKTIRSKMIELERSRSADEDEEMKGGVLSYLLAKKELTFDAIVANVTELMLAGVDTTSNSLCFAVHLLTKNPHTKDKLYNEVRHVVGDRSATTDDLQSMPYLRAVVKETLRYYPVVFLNVRETRVPITLGEYRVDAGVIVASNIYAMCRDPNTYKDPESFIPERWLRGSGDNINPFAAMPFGHGVRSCIGRRFAELELYLALIKILQHFDLKPHGDMSQLKPFNRTILSPGKIVPVEFHDRM